MAIYSDIDFNLSPILNASGQIVDVNCLLDEYDIAQSIKNIILTFSNERPFTNGNFGDLLNFKYEYISHAQQVVLYQNIGAILQTKEPRATIKSINIVQPVLGKLNITVVYSPNWDAQTEKTKTFTV
jgi:phage baseplate assembly protein W